MISSRPKADSTMCHLDVRTQNRTAIKLHSTNRRQFNNTSHKWAFILWLRNSSQGIYSTEYNTGIRKFHEHFFIFVNVGGNLYLYPNSGLLRYVMAHSSGKVL
jgi:hypothetical protein